MRRFSEYPQDASREDILEFLDEIPEKLKDGMEVEGKFIDFTEEVPAFFGLPSNTRVKLIKEVHRRLKSLYDASEKKSKKAKKDILSQEFLKPYAHSLEASNGFNLIGLINELNFSNEEMSEIKDEIDIIWECDKDAIWYEVLLKKYDINTKKNPSTHMNVIEAREYYDKISPPWTNLTRPFKRFLKRKWDKMSTKELLADYARLEDIGDDAAIEMLNIMDKEYKEKFLQYRSNGI